MIGSETYFDYLCNLLYIDDASLVVVCEVLNDILIEPEALEESRMDDIHQYRNEYLDKYADELPYAMIDDLYEQMPSVFELLATLALAIEDKVMSNPVYGNRAPKWFQDMLINLEIAPDLVYRPNGDVDVEYIKEVCDRWIDGQYNYNGDGSPFPLRQTDEDTRTMSMWRNAMLYFTENYEGKW